MGARASVKRRCSVCHASYTRGEAFCSLDGGAIVADDDASLDDELVGQTIDGRYLISRALGRGGMGKVYEAEHVGLGKTVAIKFVSDAEVARDQRARFRQEARAASKIVHEHVVQIFDVGVDAAGRDYIVMEHVDGRDLDELIRTEGILSPTRAIAITNQLLDGLHACHAAGIVHRDIKPSNIRLADGDFVKLMDFGIAKSFRAELAQTDTGTGRAIGTPQFMAPEQILDQPVDHRADLYAVGATLFAMLAGEPPFASTSFTQRMQVLAAPSIDTLRPGLPPSLVAAIARALERSPDDRFPHAVAFAAALEDGAVAAEARANAATRAAPLPGKRAAAITPPVIAGSRRWPLVTGALALIAITALVVVLVMRERTRPAFVPSPAPAPVAMVSPDASVADAAIAEPPPVDAAPVEQSKRTRVATPAVPKGPRCFCKVKVGERQSISSACKRKAPAGPRCECHQDSNRLCPFVIMVTNYDRERLPDGTKSGTMRCLDRTRPECDWKSGPVPKDCSAMSRIAKPGEACRGYKSGLTADDPMLDGKYRCNFCDLALDAPKYYGIAGEPCTGFEVSTGERATGVLECPE